MTTGTLVNFTSTDGGGLAGLTWDWLITGPATIDLPNAGPSINHVFTAAGSWTVRVTATDALGVRGTNQTFVTVVDPVPPLNANFGWVSIGPLQIQFTDTSTGPSVTAWAWNFGDPMRSGTRRTKPARHVFRGGLVQCDADSHRGNSDRPGHDLADGSGSSYTTVVGPPRCPPSRDGCGRGNGSEAPADRDTATRSCGGPAPRRNATPPCRDAPTPAWRLRAWIRRRMEGDCREISDEPNLSAQSVVHLGRHVDDVLDRGGAGDRGAQLAETVDEFRPGAEHTDLARPPLLRRNRRRITRAVTMTARSSNIPDPMTTIASVSVTSSSTPDFRLAGVFSRPEFTRQGTGFESIRTRDRRGGHGRVLLDVRPAVGDRRHRIECDPTDAGNAASVQTWRSEAWTTGPVTTYPTTSRLGMPAARSISAWSEAICSAPVARPPARSSLRRANECPRRDRLVALQLSEAGGDGIDGLERISRVRRCEFRGTADRLREPRRHLAQAFGDLITCALESLDVGARNHRTRDLVPGRVETKTGLRLVAPTHVGEVDTDRPVRKWDPVEVVDRNLEHDFVARWEDLWLRKRRELFKFRCGKPLSAIVDLVDLKAETKSRWQGDTLDRHDHAVLGAANTELREDIGHLDSDDLGVAGGAGGRRVRGRVKSTRFPQRVRRHRLDRRRRRARRTDRSANAGQGPWRQSRSRRAP